MSKAMQSPYARFAEDDLTLRDLLAVDRTIAANERTMLGFVRTALALMLSGASLIEFSDSATLNALGWALGGGAIPLILVGWWHFHRRRKGLKPLLPRIGE